MERIMYKNIKFMSRNDMSLLAHNPLAIAITISDPKIPHLNLSDKFQSVLALEFNNIESLINHPNLVRFNLTNAQTISEFVKSHEGVAETIYVNCFKGESRSAAVALALSEYYQIPLESETSLHNKFIYKTLKKVLLKNEKKPSFGM